MAKRKSTGWDPIQVHDNINPQTPMAVAFRQSGGRRHHYAYRDPQPAVRIQAFGNRLYDGIALTFEDGSMHLSFKRRDRAAVRDWRHFQAIKNEVAGLDREAIEVFPGEHELVDAANEYHLWVLPPGVESQYGFREHAVLQASQTIDHAAYRQGGPPGHMQRDWEPGIPTGLGLVQSGGRFDQPCVQCGVTLSQHPAGDGVNECPGDFPEVTDA